MESIKNESFKNVPTKRFHDYFYPKIKTKDIDTDKFFQDFSIGIIAKHRMQFFSGLRQGDRGITVEQIGIAQQKYGIDPGYLFGMTDVATPDGDYVLSEASSSYGDEYRREVGGKLREIFDKHKTNISQYAQERLGMTEQNLYKILRGQGRPYWDTVVTVCEDHGESLDLFRTKPLPKGHLLEQLSSLKSENGALKSVNEILRGRVKELEISSQNS